MILSNTEGNYDPSNNILCCFLKSNKILREFVFPDQSKLLFDKFSPNSYSDFIVNEIHYGQRNKTVQQKLLFQRECVAIKKP